MLGPGLGTLDIALSLIYSFLLVGLITASYLLLFRRKRPD